MMMLVGGVMRSVVVLGGGNGGEALMGHDDYYYYYYYHYLLTFTPHPLSHSTNLGIVNHPFETAHSSGIHLTKVPKVMVSH